MKNMSCKLKKKDVNTAVLFSLKFLKYVTLFLYFFMAIYMVQYTAIMM